MSDKILDKEIINGKVGKYVLISISVIAVIGILTTIVVFISMNNKSLKELNDKSRELKEIIVIDNEDIYGAEKYGDKVSLVYDSNKNYKIINVSGNYDTHTNPEKIKISLVFSDDGETWQHPGEGEHAYPKHLEDNKTYFMVQYVDIPFKFATVYVRNLHTDSVNNPIESFKCTIKLSN